MVQCKCRDVWKPQHGLVRALASGLLARAGTGVRRHGGQAAAAYASNGTGVKVAYIPVRHT